MIIGDRLRDLREQKRLSQGQIEKRTGLLRCYISRVENGYTVPTIETLEKWARALEVPLYQIFHSGNKPPAPPQRAKSNKSPLWGAKGKDARLLMQLRRTLSQTLESDRQLLLHMARKLARTRAA
jgi:transcriptional regulator with XRE-family HTH domain